MQYKMDTNTIKAKLILRAIDRHRKISPCGDKHTILDCFTNESGEWMLWYNVGKFTHAILESEVV